jgi:hypothetical protein
MSAEVDRADHKCQLLGRPSELAQLAGMARHHCPLDCMSGEADRADHRSAACLTVCQRRQRNLLRSTFRYYLARLSVSRPPHSGHFLHLCLNRILRNVTRSCTDRVFRTPCPKLSPAEANGEHDQHTQNDNHQHEDGTGLLTGTGTQLSLLHQWSHGVDRSWRCCLWWRWRWTNGWRRRDSNTQQHQVESLPSPWPLEDA